MRHDLNKQLCERERRGSRRKYREVRHLKKFTEHGEEGENLPSFESTMHRYRYETKDFNANLNPLYSQLRKAIGRPWSKFYSELCKNFDKRSVINQHILQHLYDRIEINVQINKNGELWVHRKYGDPQLLKDSWCEYYVDPRDGIIKINKGRETYRQAQRRRVEAAEAKEAAVTCWIDDDHVLRKIDDTWFVFTMKDLPPAHYVYEKPVDKNEFEVGYSGKTRSWDQLNESQRKRFGIRRLVGESVRDVFKNDLVSSAPHGYHPPMQRYHASKRTASHAMLKKMGIV